MQTSYDNYHRQYYLKHRKSIIARQKKYNRKHRHTKLNSICCYINTVANLEQLIGFKSLINNRLQEIKEDK